MCLRGIAEVGNKVRVGLEISTKTSLFKVGWQITINNKFNIFTFDYQGIIWRDCFFDRECPLKFAVLLPRCSNGKEFVKLVTYLFLRTKDFWQILKAKKRAINLLSGFVEIDC